MSAPSRSQASAWFDECDKSGDGCVTVQELSAKISSHCNIPDDEVVKMFTACDKDSDKMVTKQEFLEEVLKKPREKAIDEMFTAFDADGSGQLSINELEAALEKMAGEIDADTMKKIFKQADVDGSNCVDLNEFKKALSDCY